MMSVKSKNIHVVETDYHSRLAFNIEEGKYIYREDQFRYSNQEKIENRDIYITCDGFIAENSWICHDNTLITRAKEVEIIDSEWKLIVFTTDVDLIKDGVQSIDDEFLEWFVKNPSCEKVEVNNLSYGALGGFADAGYKIIIPKEFPKLNIIDNWLEKNGDPETHKQVEQEAKELCEQETLEEVANKIYHNIKNSYPVIPKNTTWIQGFVEGTKWQQEQMYSKEEVRQMLWELGDVLFNNNQNGIKEGDPEKYIEEIIQQFKN
jgi:hypothetical protein